MYNKIILLIAFVNLSYFGYSQSLVKDINRGSTSSFPIILTTLPNGKTLFFANDGTSGNELWASNGTDASLVMDINQTAGAGSFSGYGSEVYKGKLYFAANDGIHGIEMWVTDGTPGGTSIVKDFNPGKPDGWGNTQLYVYKDELYFMALDDLHGIELWKTDGITAKMIKDINPAGNSTPSYFYEAFNKLFFSAKNDVSGNEWFTTDGTPEGTKLFADLNPGLLGGALSPLIMFKNWAYFTGANAQVGIELFRTNGDTIELVKDIYPGATNSGNPTDFMIAGSNLFFWANDGINGFELWKTDGTAGNATLVKNIVSGSGSSSGFIIGELKGKLIFVDYEPMAGNEIWVSDGTAGNTVVLKDIFPGSGNGTVTLNSETFSKTAYSHIKSNFVYNGNYYFAGTDATNGLELWKTDGTAEGTKMVYQINLAGSSALQWIYVDEKKVWLSATNGQTGTELFTYTIPTTSVSNIKRNNILEIYPNPASSEIVIKELGDLTIIDMFGKVVYDINNNGKAIDISNLPGGVYSFKIINGEGIHTSRFIKD